MLRAIGIRLLLVACFLLFFTSPLFANDLSANLKDQAEKESYSIGYQVGLSIKVDGVEVVFDKLMQGLHDAIDGKEPLLSAPEMKGLIVALKKKAREIQLRKIQEQIVKNAEESEKFLAKNGKQEGVRTTENGLQYKILREGKGPVPKPEDLVTLNYRGTFIDGKEFDSSYTKGKPQTVEVDGVIKGWTEALQMMTVGSKWRIFVPPQLAYGRGGSGRIPPNKVLIFEVELLSIKTKTSSS